MTINKPNFLFYNRGGRIQPIVSEKQDVIHAFVATLIEFMLAIILFIFKEINSLPINTTWFFLRV